MTTTELLSKIKDFANEQKELLSGFELQSDFRRGETAAYSAIISFLSTLESEKPENQDEELNEEIKKEMVKLPFFIRGKDQIAFARHFAQWGAEHLKK